MRPALVIGAATAVLWIAGFGTAAHAICTAAAAPVALQNFDTDPVAWIKANTGKSDVGEQVLALAAAATNAQDQAFGAALNAMLLNATGDDGTAIGKSLAGLVNACTDARDPGDKVDKQYIAENIARNLLVNVAANTAFGNQDGPQSAATDASGTGTGAGSGTGLGIGPVAGSPPSGGDNNGSPTGGTNDTQTGNRVPPSGSTGATGASTTATQTQTQTGSTPNSRTTAL